MFSHLLVLQFNHCWFILSFHLQAHIIMKHYTCRCAHPFLSSCSLLFVNFERETKMHIEHIVLDFFFSCSSWKSGHFFSELRSLPRKSGAETGLTFYWGNLLLAIICHGLLFPGSVCLLIRIAKLYSVLNKTLPRSLLAMGKNQNV